MYLVKANNELWADCFVPTEGQKLYSNGKQHLTDHEIGIVEPVSAEEVGVLSVRLIGGIRVAFQPDENGQIDEYSIAATTLGMVEDFRRRMIHPIKVYSSKEVVEMDYHEDFLSHSTLSESDGLIRFFNDNHRIVPEEEHGQEDTVIAEIEIDAVVFIHSELIDPHKLEMMQQCRTELNVASPNAKDLYLSLIYIEEELPDGEDTSGGSDSDSSDEPAHNDTPEQQTAGSDA